MVRKKKELSTKNKNLNVCKNIRAWRSLIKNKKTALDNEPLFLSLINC